MNTITIKPKFSAVETIANIKLGYKEKRVSENFVHNPRTVGLWEYKIVSFEKEVNASEAKKLCNIDGWKVGNIEHLLVYGAKFPEQNRKRPIIALGTMYSISGTRYNPMFWYRQKETLFGEYYTRNLGMGIYSGYRPAGCSFICVRRYKES